MPFEPLYGQPEVGSDLYRRLRLGANAELFLLDERQYRDDQPCDDAFFAPCPEAETEPRRFLGNRQLEWLKRRLRTSGATWKLIGNQLMIMSLELAQGAQINKDSWDGYGVERREILDYVARQGHRQRELPDRRHPHLLRRRRGRERPRAGERRHRVRGRLGHLAGHPRDGAVHHRRAAHRASRPRC